MSKKSTIAGLINDNTNGDISAKDLRDAFDEVDPEQQAPMQEYKLQGSAPKMKMEIASGGVGAEMEVLYGATTVASMQWNKINQEFAFSLFDKDSGATKASFAIKPDGKAYVGGKAIPDEAWVEKEIREFRTTVDFDTAGATPTRTECISAFKQLPHFEFTKDDDFYIRMVDRTKMSLVKYRALSTSKDEATAGEFWIEKLTLTK